MEEVGEPAPRQPSKGGVSLLTPLQLYRHPPCPAWGLLCHHHLASGTSHPLNQPHRSIGLELGDLGPERTPVCRCPCPQSRDPPDPSPPHPGVTSAGRLGVSPPTVGGSAPSAPLTPESDHLKERLPPGPASRKVAQGSLAMWPRAPRRVVCRHRCLWTVPTLETQRSGGTQFSSPAPRPGRMPNPPPMQDPGSGPLASPSSGWRAGPCRPPQEAPAGVVTPGYVS